MKERKCVSFFLSSSSFPSIRFLKRVTFLFFLLIFLLPSFSFFLEVVSVKPLDAHQVAMMAAPPPPAAAPPSQQQRSRLPLRDTLPEGASPALVALLEQSDGEDDDTENAKKGGENDENGIVDAAGAPLGKASSFSALPPPLSPSERARAFAAAPRELEALKDHPVIAAALFRKCEIDDGGERATTTTNREDALS